MDRRTPFMVLPLAALAVSPACYAVQYLSVEQAQAIMFPDTILTAAPLTLTDVQKREIEQRSGMKVRQTTLKRWRAANGGYFVLDQVLGKHEFITYAVALDSTGAVRQVEILDFRETHGDEVRRAAWRNQFTGKTQP